MNQPNLQPILIVDENRGIYAAQEMFNFLRVSNPVEIENLPYWAYKALEQGPDNEEYLEACEEMDKLEILYYEGEEGNLYNPYQNGDYWLVPIGYEWPEE